MDRFTLKFLRWSKQTSAASNGMRRKGRWERCGSRKACLACHILRPPLAHNDVAEMLLIWSLWSIFNISSLADRRVINFRIKTYTDLNMKAAFDDSVACLLGS